MKHILTLGLLLVGNLAIAQVGIPDFLQGTWKVKDKDHFEHWDQLNEGSMKGFSYKMTNGQMEVSEYLDIAKSENGLVYTASVLKQNGGEGVEFLLVEADSAWVFENPTHDFPKRILYQKINDNELFVQVSDGKQNGVGYKMEKQLQTVAAKDTTINNPNYDPALAQKLGADDYGMKSYVLAILKTGPNQSTDQAFISNSFRGHMDNINHLAKEGKLTVAGPLGKNDKTYRGIFILNVQTFEEAESLLQQDTAIKEGLLSYELYPWYGSAALSQYLESSDKIWKIKP